MYIGTSRGSKKDLFIFKDKYRYKNMSIQIYWKFYHLKWKFSDNKILIFFIILHKTKIVGTRLNHLDKVVLTSTHNLCFWAEVRKIMYTPVNPVLLNKSGI